MSDQNELIENIALYIYKTVLDNEPPKDPPIALDLESGECSECNKKIDNNVLEYSVSNPRARTAIACCLHHVTNHL